MSEIAFPAAFRFLFADRADDGLPVRYRAAYGGRGSGKSLNFARALVVKGAHTRHKILCFREVQKSVKESVKAEIEAAIADCGLGAFYEVLDTEIRGRNGTEFVFAGIRNTAKNTAARSLKSMKGVTIAWGDEANTVSKTSFDILDPTIREVGSEIWLTWNPDEPTDPVDSIFRADVLPPGSIVREVNYDDNPWFSETPLQALMEHDRKRDPEKYEHVWRGSYQRSSEARVFRNWKVEEFDTPADAVFRFGADWGFSVDPTVLIRCWLDGRTLYVDQEAWEVGCEIDKTPALFDTIEGAKRWTITADSSRPETVSYMRRQGYRIVPAIKGPGSVEDGIEFLKSFDIIVHPRCTHVADELTRYSFKTDSLTGEVLPVLEDKDNHTIDALRYALEALRRTFKKQAPPPAPVRDRWDRVREDGPSWKTA